MLLAKRFVTCGSVVPLPWTRYKSVLLNLNWKERSSSAISERAGRQLGDKFFLREVSATRTTVRTLPCGALGEHVTRASRLTTAKIKTNKKNKNNFF
jgi:hypothetical protein